jgi:Leucine-rich repeat (LRR) protein
MHTVPENGFTTNKLILKLLNEQPSEVYRGKNAEELKDTLKNIEGLAHLKKLAYLDLSNNLIEELPSDLSAVLPCDSLMILKLQGNPLP